MTEADAGEEMTRLLAAERMPMVHLATLLVGSVAVAEEVVQDAFLSLSERWNEIDRPDEYLRTAVADRSVSELRRRSVEGRSRSPAGQESAHRIPEQLVELYGALARLSDRHRAVVVLRYLAGLPDARIAETLGVRPAAVRSLTHRALAALSQSVATGGLEERLRQQLPALAAAIVESHAADAGQETASIWPRQPRKRRRSIQLAVLAVLLAAAALIAGSVLVDQPAERATTSSPPSTLPADTVPATTTLPGTESEAATEPPASETPVSQPPTTEPPTAESPTTTTSPEPEPEPEPPATTSPEPEPPTSAVTPEPIDDDPCTSSATVDRALGGLVADCYALWIFSLFQNADEQFNSDPDTAWVAGNPLQNWLGVTVSGGRVTGLHLDGLDLYVLESSLEYLDSLERLVLSNNELSGPIPAEIGDLTNLRHLDLSNNQLSGPIPPELGNLTNLRYLDLSNNQLTGELPPELTNLTNLQHLDLSRNEVSFDLPAQLLDRFDTP